jgi:transcription antitermination factor NusG
MGESEGKKWYVARTNARHEKKVYEKILSLGVKAYLPIREELRQWHDRKKKVDVVLTPCVLFIYADKTTALSLPNEMGLKLQYMLDYTNKGKKLMVVPDNQMEDFIAFVGVADDTFRMEDDLLYVKGDKIIVTSGVMKGVTGELVKVGREDRILVRLDGVLACSMVMSSDMFEKIHV